MQPEKTFQDILRETPLTYVQLVKEAFIAGVLDMQRTVERGERPDWAAESCRYIATNQAEYRRMAGLLEDVDL